MRRAALLLGVLVGLSAATRARAGDPFGDTAALQARIEADVRRLVADRAASNLTALDTDVAELEDWDRLRAAGGLSPTGLTDEARYLAAGAAPSRDARRDALEDLLDEDPDAAVRRLAEHQLESDDAATADRLLANDRHNRRAGLVNDFVRPFGIFSGGAVLAALNPFLLAGSAVDSLATTAVNLWNWNRLSTPEREALARYRKSLVREPHTADAPEIARAIRRLSPRRAKALCADTVATGEKALDADDLDRALFYFRTAAGMDDCAARARKPLRRAEEDFARRKVREDAGLWPADDPLLPEAGDEADDWRALLYATALGDPGAMVEAGDRFAVRHEDSDLEPGARYAVGVARLMAGHEDEGRAALEALADDDSQVGHHAAAVLADARFTGLDAIGEAESRHTREVLRYVFLGNAFNGRDVVHGAAQVGASGVSGASTLGIANVIGVATRAWQAWRKDPASNQAIIDRGEEFLARDPDAADAADVHERLATAYERAGDYERALLHYRAVPDASEKRLEKLRAELAAKILDEAKRTGNDPVLLEGIGRHFPDTDAAEEAGKLLASAPPPGTTVDRTALRAHPALLGPDALDLPATLLDGDQANGELAEEGVTLAEGKMTLTLEADGDPPTRVETRDLAPEAYARARAAAQEVLYENLLTADRRNPEEGRFERYIPIYVQGSVGESGVSVVPGIKMRRYESSQPELYR
jgi:tetratricopeptide (TPR) repeat protein